MSRPVPQRKTDLLIRLALLGAIPMIIFLALGFIQIRQSREATLERANNDARQLVRTMEAGVSATMQSAEIAADYIVAGARARFAAGVHPWRELPPGFVRIAQDWPFIQSVSFIEANGQMGQSLLRDESGQLRPSRIFDGIDFFERPTFTTHVNAAPELDPIYLSEVKTGESSKIPIIVMTKGAWTSEGKFLGVASIAVRLDAIEKIFKTATPIEGGAITLFRGDGLLLYAPPYSNMAVGNMYADSRLFRTYIRDSLEGAYSAFTRQDGLERIFAYRVAPRYPFVVVAAVPMTRVLADWQRSSLVLAIGCLLSLLVIGALTVSLMRRYRLNHAVEDALRESEAKLKDLVECSSDYQWETNADGIVQALSGQATQSFIPVMGKHGHTIFASSSEPHDQAEFMDLVRRRLPIRNLVLPMQGRDGELRWVRNSANPIFDANGHYRGYRGVGTDITEVRRQRKTIEAQRKNEALGRLTSGLAHEINNLLQPILVYSGSRPNDQADTDTASSFTKIRRAAESASAIIKNVLAFARESPPRKTHIDLADAVLDTLDVASARIPSSIIVVVDIPPSTPAVWVDRTGFAQALTNLLNNAIEAILSKPGGAGALSITAREIHVLPSGDQRLGLRPGRYCKLMVADNGPGIPAAGLENIFDPFYTTKPQGEGTGLGLSVVTGLTKSWGGAVDVVSVPDVKTEFSLYLPIAEQQMQAAQ